MPSEGRRDAAFCLCLCLAAAGGCAGEPGTRSLQERVGGQRHAIRGGEADDSDSAVIGMRAFPPMELPLNCTGTLIAPNVVLTAWHCLAKVRVGAGGPCPIEVTSTLGPDAVFYSSANPTPLDMAELLPVREVLTPAAEGELCGRDRAILVLERSVPAAEATPMVPRVDVPLATAEEYAAVGFGGTDDTAADAFLRRRLDGLKVGCVAEECALPGTYGASEWIGERGVCPGDSGGPALDRAQRVIGVASRGVVGCEDPIYGYLFPWASWVKTSVLRAAELGGYVAPTWASGYPTDPVYSAPVGAACTAPAECVSNRCLEGYCTRPCTELALCPDGFVCAGLPPLCSRPPTPGMACSVRGAAPVERGAMRGWLLLALALGAWWRRGRWPRIRLSTQRSPGSGRP